MLSINVQTRNWHKTKWNSKAAIMSTKESIPWWVKTSLLIPSLLTGLPLNVIQGDRSPVHVKQLHFNDFQEETPVYTIWGPDSGFWGLNTCIPYGLQITDSKSEQMSKETKWSLLSTISLMLFWQKGESLFNWTFYKWICGNCSTTEIT